MFNLPSSTRVSKSIPKKSFDHLISAKHKKWFTESINKIRWTNKLSSQTVNLDGLEIDEIEIFELELKKKENLISILDIIDKNISYPIIFIVCFEGKKMLSISKKHIHPVNENQAVVDFRFNSDWINAKDFHYELNLRKNLDFVFSDICVQTTNRKHNEKLDITELVEKERNIKQMKFNIEKLQCQIRNCKQFNRKVELNIKLKDLEKKFALLN